MSPPDSSSNATTASNNTTPTPRTGQGAGHLDRVTFGQRFRQSFADPHFDQAKAQIALLEDIAWQNYQDGRKAPLTRTAGAGYADPDYEIAIEWLDTKAAIDNAKLTQADKTTPDRVLIIIASHRNDDTCPGEVSKSWRLANIAKARLEREGSVCEVIDLSRLTSEYGLNIHPCKGCVSTAMPLCHFPCSCYPNHSLDQTGDWMNEIYIKLAAAHGLLIVTPTYWYQSPGGLKNLMDRLVCIDGGNPDPSSTHGKKAIEAKRIELNGWDYPKHLPGRAYAVIVHGDVAGVEAQRRNLCDQLDWMGFIAAGFKGRLDRYIGYYESYAESHEALDQDQAMQAEALMVAEALQLTIGQLRQGIDLQPTQQVKAVRPK